MHAAQLVNVQVKCSPSTQLPPLYACRRLQQKEDENGNIVEDTSDPLGGDAFITWTDDLPQAVLIQGQGEDIRTTKTVAAFCMLAVSCCCGLGDSLGSSSLPSCPEHSSSVKHAAQGAVVCRWLRCMRLHLGGVACLLSACPL